MSQGEAAGHLTPAARQSHHHACISDDDDLCVLASSPCSKQVMLWPGQGCADGSAGGNDAADVLVLTGRLRMRLLLLWHC